MSGKDVNKLKQLESLMKSRYAHRGLHTKPTIPENSMVAFSRAIEEGFGIELDVHLTADGKLAVIHDSSLKRTCGIDLTIEEISLKEAQVYLLEESHEVIPDFVEVLKYVDGRVPLLVELKEADGNHESLTDKVMEALEQYEGLYCIESFSPAVVKALRKKYPHVIRGQLAGALNKEEKTVTGFQDFLLRNLWVNIPGKPDFVSYRFEDRDEEAFVRFKGAKFCWTIKDYSDMKVCEAMGAATIFEQFNPKNYE